MFVMQRSSSSLFKSDHSRSKAWLMRQLMYLMVMRALSLLRVFNVRFSFVLSWTSANSVPRHSNINYNDVTLLLDAVSYHAQRYTSNSVPRHSNINYNDVTLLLDAISYRAQWYISNSVPRHSNINYNDVTLLLDAISYRAQWYISNSVPRHRNINYNDVALLLDAVSYHAQWYTTNAHQYQSMSKLQGNQEAKPHY